MKPSEFSLDPTLSALKAAATDTQQTGGVQGWSVGESFPWMVHLEEEYVSGPVALSLAARLLSKHWVVSYAGHPLYYAHDSSFAHAFAIELKRRGIYDRETATWLASELQDAVDALRSGPKRFALDMGAKRDAESDRQLRGGASDDTSLADVLADRRLERARVDMVEGMREMAKHYA